MGEIERKIVAGLGEFLDKRNAGEPIEAKRVERCTNCLGRKELMVPRGHALVRVKCAYCNGKGYIRSLSGL